MTHCTIWYMKIVLLVVNPENHVVNDYLLWAPGTLSLPYTLMAICWASTASCTYNKYKHSVSTPISFLGSTRCNQRMQPKLIFPFHLNGMHTSGFSMLRFHGFMYSIISCFPHWRRAIPETFVLFHKMTFLNTVFYLTSDIFIISTECYIQALHVRVMQMSLSHICI